MSNQDYIIWQRWHILNWRHFHRFYYDAAVGKGQEPPPGGPDKMRAAWIRITKKRVDAIGLTADSVWILEVRPTAGLAALGAVLGYLHLIREDNPFSLPLRAAILTDLMDDDVRRVITAYNVQALIA